MTNKTLTTNPLANKAINPPPNLFWMTGFVRPELSYAVDPATGEANHHCWAFYDANDSAYPDDLMADTRKHLTEYDRMVMARTPRDDDRVTQWFIDNATRHGHSLDTIYPVLMHWFAPASMELAA